MSPRTWLANLTAVLLALLPSAPLVAAPVEDAQSTLSAAYNRYFDQLKSGATVTRESIQAARAQTLDAAATHMNEGLAKEIPLGASEVRKEVPKNDFSRQDFSAMLPDFHEALQNPSMIGPAPASAGTSASSPPVVIEKSYEPPKAEIAIDGSNVPQEIDFPGPAVVAPAPSPNPKKHR